MPFHFHLEAFTYAAATIVLLYIAGYWLAALLCGDRQDTDMWAYAPLVGLGVQTILIENLNYLGMPVRYGTPLLLALFLILDLIVLKRRWREAVVVSVRNKAAALGIALLGTAAFILPFGLYGGFPALSDAFYYCAVADFVHGHSYFASAEPAHIYPWLSQMLMAQFTHSRMGAQYFHASSDALLGINAFTNFIPITATFLFTSFCGLSLLAKRLLRSSRVAILACLTAYCLNVLLVLWAPAQNFLSQTPGLGFMYGMMASFLVFSEKDATWRDVVAGGLFTSGLVTYYPELLPFALVPIFLYIFLRFAEGMYVRGREICRRSLPYGIAAMLVSVIINPYTWYYTVQGIIMAVRSNGRPGFQFLPPSKALVELYFSLIGPEGWWHPLLMYPLLLLGAALAIITFVGFIRLHYEARVFITGAAAIYFIAGIYIVMVEHYNYGFLKLLVYSFFLVPICFGSGVAYFLKNPVQSLLGGTVRALLGVWALAGLLSLTSFVRTGYGMTLNGAYHHPDSPALFMKYYEDFSNVSSAIKPGEKALVFVRDDGYARWIPYFYRKPMGDYFKGGYFGIIAGRAIDSLDSYRYIIGTNAISWKDNRELVFSNGLFSMSQTQAFLTLGEKGWYDTEFIAGKTMHWTAKQAEVIAFSPKPDLVALKTFVHRPPDGAVKHLNVTVNGQPAAKYVVDKDPFELETPLLTLKAGLNKIVFETDESPKRYGADPRDLSLLFEKVEFVRYAPLVLAARSAADQQYLEGLTPDGWVPAEGIRIRFEKPASSHPILDITGDVYDNRAVPIQVIRISVNGSWEKAVSINDAKPFEVSIPLPASGDARLLDVTIRGEKTFCPKDVHMGDDPRVLAFHLTSVALKE